VRSAGSEAERQQEHAAAAALVRLRDRDRYWSALFAPPSQRAGLNALYAFNAELSQISSAESEPMAAHIRLQWWRDAIGNAAPGTKTGHPIADALTAAMSRHNLPKEPLLRIVDAQLPGIYGETPADMDALKTQLEESSGTLFEMAAAILGDAQEGTRKAAQDAGFAFGLRGLLLSLPNQALRRKLALPESCLKTHRVEIDSLYQGNTGPGLAAMLSELRDAANLALERFRLEAANIDKAAWPAFLPLALVRPYLKAMAAPGHDPLRQIVTLSPVARFWCIWRAARQNRI
jgi:phytoene synthase